MARMKLRALGVHNMESSETLLPSYLVDGVLALDAGSLTRSLAFDEQCAIGAVLLTHGHNDHVRDLPALRHNLASAGRSVDVYGLPETISHICGRYLPDGGVGNGAVRPVRIDSAESLPVGAHTVRAVRMRHGVPCAGYEVSDGEVRLFYTGDTGSGLGAVWRSVEPDVLLTEVTYGNDNTEAALRQGHLTPGLLDAELAEFRSVRGYLPRVIVTHMNPPWEDAIRGEIEVLARSIDTDVTVASPGSTFRIRRAGRR